MAMDTPRLRHEFPIVVAVVRRRLVAHRFLTWGPLPRKSK